MGVLLYKFLKYAFLSLDILLSFCCTVIPHYLYTGFKWQQIKPFLIQPSRHSKNRYIGSQNKKLPVNVNFNVLFDHLSTNHSMVEIPDL